MCVCTPAPQQLAIPTSLCFGGGRVFVAQGDAKREKMDGAGEISDRFLYQFAQLRRTARYNDRTTGLLEVACCLEILEVDLLVLLPGHTDFLFAI